jgi:chorismate mutase
VRGATTADENTRDAILDATRKLLTEIVVANDLRPDDLASAIFTTTTDLTAAYPAEAARQLGWIHVPLLCTNEMEVDSGLQRCIRILLHWNTMQPADQIRHIYLGEAQRLRPDLVAQANMQSVE